MTLGAGVGLGVSSAKSNGGSAGSAGKSISGNMDFTLFPDSRFPTNFGFAVSDSRQEVKDNVLLRGQGSQSRRFYLRQIYNSPGGLNSSAWFDQSSGSTSYASGVSIDRSFGFQLHKRFGYHDVQFGGGLFENIPATYDSKGISSNLAASHNYFPTGEVGVSSSASYSSAKTTGGVNSDFSSSYEQVSSSFYWRPEHRPYFVSGGVMVYSVQSGSVSRGVATNASASYQIARNISVNAGLSVSVADAAGSQTLSASQSLSTSLPSDRYVLFGLDYGWNVGLGVSNNVQRMDRAANALDGELNGGKTKQNQQSVNVGASHNLGHAWNLGRSTTTSLNFSQSASTSKSSNSAPTSSLGNSASVGWSNYGFGGNTSANVSSSYSRSFSKDGVASQVVSGQLARSQELSRLSSLSGSLNFQASRSQRSSNGVSKDNPSVQQGSSGITKSASAAFNYSHGRFLGIYGLTYNSTLSIPSLLKGDGTQSTSGKNWDNTFGYSIGRLGLGLSAHVSESGPGQRAYSMAFSAVRSF